MQYLEFLPHGAGVEQLLQLTAAGIEFARTVRDNGGNGIGGVVHKKRLLTGHADFGKSVPLQNPGEKIPADVNR